MGLFLRALVRKLLTNLATHELSAFTDGHYTTEDDTTTDPVNILRLQIRYKVVRTGLQDDVFENVLHFVNTAGELPGSIATDTQKAAVEAAYDSFWSSIASRVPAQVFLAEYRWYHFNFDDTLTGPPTRVTTKTTPVAGSLSQALPQQACSITLRTPLRRYWGRIYIPGGQLGTVGLAGTATVDAMANGFKTFAQACDATDLNVVVYSKVKQAVFAVSAIECDDVLDVVRRRRPKNSTYRKILTS